MVFSKFRLLSRVSRFSALCCHCEVPDIFPLPGGTGQALTFVPNCGYVLQHTSKLKQLGAWDLYLCFVAIYVFIHLGVQEDGDSFLKTLAVEIKEIIPILCEIERNIFSVAATASSTPRDVISNLGCRQLLCSESAVPAQTAYSCLLSVQPPNFWN